MIRCVLFLACFALSAEAFSVGRYLVKRNVAASTLLSLRAQPGGEPMSIGSLLPDMDVEVLNLDKEGKVMTAMVPLSDLVGTGTCVVVGMPGAFTPACTAEHLPGYVMAAPALKDLGVDRIAIVTTNDKYVNAAWSRQVIGEEKVGDVLSIINDGDATLVGSMGLIENMPGMGSRSKRFALIAKDGAVTHLMTDEGMDECLHTRASNVMEILEQSTMVTKEAFRIPAAFATVGLALFVGVSTFMYFDPTSTVVQIDPTQQQMYNLLDTYM